MTFCSIAQTGPGSHRVFDVPFEYLSNFDLPLSSGSTTALAVSESSLPIAPDGAGEELSSWQLDSGVTWLRAFRTASGFHLSFPQYVDLLVSPDGTHVLFYRKPGVPQATIEHLLVDKALPLVLSLSQNSVLHCSAVASPRGGLVFTGKTGQGKSTLAASFAMRGFPLITDDSLLLGMDREIMAAPGYPSLRLWPEDIRHFEGLAAEVCDVAHYTSKKRLQMNSPSNSFAQKPVKALAVYVLSDTTAPSHAPASQSCTSLDDDDRIVIEKLSPREGFLELLQNSIQLDTVGAVSLKAQSERLSIFANTIPAFRLSYPRNHALLPKVVETILAHAAALKGAN